MNAASAVEQVRRRLKAVSSPARAASEKRYLKSELTFLGATVPQVRAEAKAFVREHAPKPPALWELVDSAWDTGVHELRSWAVFVLETRAEELTVSELKKVERLLREAKTWAHVDEIATHVAGPVVERCPTALRTVRRWARDEDFWIRRSALLCLLVPLREGRGDFALFEELSVPMLAEKEFFIRKAIGWILREMAKKQPERTFDFLREHRAAVSGLTLREGAKYLSAVQRVTLGLG